MAIHFSTSLSNTVKENRWSAEFYNPIFSIPKTSNLEWVRIGRILSFYQYGLSIKMNEEGNGIPIYRLNEIEDCFMSNDPIKYAKISDNEKRIFSLKKNDVLFCRTNGNINLVGRTGIFKEHKQIVFASYLVRVQTKPEQLLPEFLTIYLNSSIGKKQILRRAMPSNQVNVSAAELRRIFIPVVDLSFQKEIAFKLNESYKLKQESISLYSQAQSLLEKELGIDKIRFSITNHFNAKYNSTILFNRFDSEYYKPKYSQIKSLIRNYKYGFEPFLNKIFNISPNINPSSIPTEEFDYIELSNINGKLGIVDGSTKVLGLSAPSRAQRQVRTGDVIASSVVGSVDKSALISENENKFLASSGFFHLRSNEYSPQFLLVLMQSKILTEQLNQEATGGILSAVPNDKLKFIIVPIVPIVLQNAISDLILKSHSAYLGSKHLLSSAIKQVEELIETEAAKNN